jgi:hypothetical protein
MEIPKPKRDEIEQLVTRGYRERLEDVYRTRGWERFEEELTSLAYEHLPHPEEGVFTEDEMCEVVGRRISAALEAFEKVLKGEK